MVQEITQISEVPQEGKVVIDFHATWCGPCKRIAPLFQEIAGKYPQVSFFKVDVDEASELSEKFGIESLPTFVFLVNGKITRRMEGANPNELLSIVDALSELGRV